MEMEREIQKLVSQISKKFSGKGELLYLSLVGNYVFGWGKKEFSQEVYGIFALPNFWDKVYLHLPKFYVTLFNLEHLINHEFKTPENLKVFAKCSLNFANPIYIHKKFDFKTLFSFFKPSIVLTKPTLYFDFVYFPFSIDGVLRYYHFLLCAIYFLKTKKLELNLFELEKKNGYKFPILRKLKKLFLATFEGGKVAPLSFEEKMEIKNNLDTLFKDFIELKAKTKKEEIDLEKFENWKERMRKTFLK
jgi:hypothetical protein